MQFCLNKSAHSIINSRSTKDGKTALLLTPTVRNLEDAKKHVNLLIEHGANIDAVDDR